MAAYETRARTAVRSIVWRVFGVILTAVLTVVLGGSVRLAVELGLLYNAIRLVTHYFHDRAWAHIKWGILVPAQQPAPLVPLEWRVHCSLDGKVYRFSDGGVADQFLGDHVSADECHGPHHAEAVVIRYPGEQA